MKEQGKPYNNKSSAVNLHLPHIYVRPYVDVAVPDECVGWYSGIHVYEWNKENFTFQLKEKRKNGWKNKI